MAANYEQLWSSTPFRENKSRTTFPSDVFLSLVHFLDTKTRIKGDLYEGANTVTDWGCGNGSSAISFDLKGMQVTGLNDIAPNCLDEYAKGMFGDIFEAKPVWEADPVPARFSYCSEVLEHMDEKDIGPSLDNMVAHTLRPGFLFITVPSTGDTWRGIELHRTIQPFPWWMDLFHEHIKGQCMFTYNLFGANLGSLWFIK